MSEINPNQPVGQPSHKEAKAQAKAAKAYAKAQRPWFKKKRFIIPGALVALMVVGSMANGGSEDPAVASSNDTNSTAVVSPKSTNRSHDTGKEAKATSKSTKPSKPAEPEMTAGQANALQAGQNYIDMMPFSHDGLIQQLSSPAGDGYSKADGTFAADHVNVDWNKEAAEAAKNYLDMTPFSRSGLIQQLTSSAGDQYTHKQAVYGVNKAGL